MRKIFTAIGNFCILLSILATPLLIIYKIDKLDSKKDVSDVFDKGIYATRLTETEIKQKDKLLWQFAREAEDE